MNINELKVGDKISTFIDVTVNIDIYESKLDWINLYSSLDYIVLYISDDYIIVSDTGYYNTNRLFLGASKFTINAKY